jgi:hypothetical protein
MAKTHEDVRPPDQDDGGELRPGEKITIVIDGKKYRAPARSMTGAQLRRLANPNIGPDYDLWQEVPGGEDNLVDDNERIKLRDGMGFYSSSRDINPG